MELVLLLECILTVAVSLAVYLYLLVSFYPRVTLRPVWKGGSRDVYATGDRGLRRLVFPEGRATVYEPAPKARRYLRRYALIKQEGCTYVKCSIHERIAHIRYDVAAFDSRGRLLDVISVSERIAERGCTRAVRLPRATAYACVTLRKADGVYTGEDVTLGYSMKGIAIYTGLCVVTAALLGGILQGSLSEAVKLFSDAAEVAGMGLSVTVATILGAFCAEGIVLMHYLHSIRVMNK